MSHPVPTFALRSQYTRWDTHQRMAASRGHRTTRRVLRQRIRDAEAVGTLPLLSFPSGMVDDSVRTLPAFLQAQWFYAVSQVDWTSLPVHRQELLRLKIFSFADTETWTERLDALDAIVGTGWEPTGPTPVKHRPLRPGPRTGWLARAGALALLLQPSAGTSIAEPYGLTHRITAEQNLKSLNASMLDVIQPKISALMHGDLVLGVRMNQAPERLYVRTIFEEINQWVQSGLQTFSEHAVEGNTWGLSRQEGLTPAAIHALLVVFPLDTQTDLFHSPLYTLLFQMTDSLQARLRDWLVVEHKTPREQEDFVLVWLLMMRMIEFAAQNHTGSGTGTGTGTMRPVSMEDVQVARAAFMGVGTAVTVYGETDSTTDPIDILGSCRQIERSVNTAIAAITARAEFTTAIQEMTRSLQEITQEKQQLVQLMLDQVALDRLKQYGAMLTTCVVTILGLLKVCGIPCVECRRPIDLARTNHSTTNPEPDLQSDDSDDPGVQDHQPISYLCSTCHMSVLRVRLKAHENTRGHLRALSVAAPDTTTTGSDPGHRGAMSTRTTFRDHLQ